MIRYNDYSDTNTIQRLESIGIYIYPDSHKLIFNCHGPSFEYRANDFRYIANELHLVVKRKAKGRYHVIPPLGEISELKRYLVYDFETGKLGEYGRFMSDKSKLVKSKQREWLAASKTLAPRITAMFRLSRPDISGQDYNYPSVPYSYTATEELYNALTTGVVSAKLIDVVVGVLRNNWRLAEAVKQGDSGMFDVMNKITKDLLELHKHEIRKRFGVWGEYND